VRRGVGYVGSLLFLHLVQEAELEPRHDGVGGRVVEDEEEGDVVGILLAVAVGEVPDSPGAACDAEGAGLDVLAVG
jgi:hypothetical protein